MNRVKFSERALASTSVICTIRINYHFDAFIARHIPGI